MKRSRLGPRLTAVMGLALLPLTVLSYVQADKGDRLVESRSQAAILGDTLAAAAPMDEALTRAQSAAETLAGLIPSLQGEACNTALARFVSDSGFYSFAGFTKADGIMECSSKGGVHDFSTSERFRALIADPKPRLTSLPGAAMSKTDVLTVTRPVWAGEQLLGILSLSVPHDVLRHQANSLDGGNPLALIVLDAQGNVLTSTIALEDTPARMPQTWQASALAGDVRDSFIDTSVDGVRSAFALVPIVPDQVYLLGSWPVDRLTDSLSTPIFPALIWAASLLVAWIAAETQVLRHVRNLRGAITDFAAGRRGQKPPDLSRAPAELAEMGEAFATMTEAVTRGEAELENSIHQKQLLLREVHHRVKNNLQLIASILNMQSRTIQVPEVRDAMRGVRERVLALATIHQELYQTSGVTSVQMSELLPLMLGHQLKLAALPGRDPGLAFRIDDISLTPEQAVPLALFVTEALSPSIGMKGIEVDLLRQGDGSALLTLTQDGGRAEDRFHAQLLEAFSAQLRGEMLRSETETGRRRLSLQFPIGPEGV